MKINGNLGFPPVSVMWQCGKSRSIKTDTRWFSPDRRLQKVFHSGLKQRKK